MLQNSPHGHGSVRAEDVIPVLGTFLNHYDQNMIETREYSFILAQEFGGFNG